SSSESTTSSVAGVADRAPGSAATATGWRSGSATTATGRRSGSSARWPTHHTRIKISPRMGAIPTIARVIAPIVNPRLPVPVPGWRLPRRWYTGTGSGVRGAEATDAASLEVRVQDRDQPERGFVVSRVVEQPDLHAAQLAGPVEDADREAALDALDAVVSTDRDAGEVDRLQPDRVDREPPDVRAVDLVAGEGDPADGPVGLDGAEGEVEPGDRSAVGRNGEAGQVETGNPSAADEGEAGEVDAAQAPLGDIGEAAEVEACHAALGHVGESGDTDPRHVALGHRGEPGDVDPAHAPLGNGAEPGNRGAARVAAGHDGDGRHGDAS